MQNGHDYAVSDDEPTVPSFKIDLKRGKIVNQFGFTALSKPKLTFDFEFRLGVGLGVFWHQFSQSIEISVPFFKIWIHQS